MEVFLKLFHQLRGKGRKILLTQTNDQKVTGDNVIDLAVLVPQGTIQVFPHDFSLIVHHQCDRLIKRINSFNVATDSFLQILQIAADLNLLGIHIGLYQKHRHGFCLFLLNLTFLRSAKLNAGKVLGVQNVLGIVVGCSDLFFCISTGLGFHRYRLFQRLRDFYIVFLQTSLPPFPQI